MAPRVGFVTTSFPRFEGDTAGSFVFGMARALVGRNIDIEVIVPEPCDETDWEDGGKWLSGIRVFGVPYARPKSLQRLFFGGGAPDNLSGRPLVATLVPSAIVQLTRAAAKRIRSWDAAVSHWIVPSSFAVALASLLTASNQRMPHLTIAHSGDIHLLSSRLLRPLASLVPKTASAVGFISQRLRNKYLGLLPAGEAKRIFPMTYITPMGIEPCEFSTAKSREQLRAALDLRDFTVLFLGRLVPIKGVDVLLQAMRGLGGAELLVGGDGPLRSFLEKRAREMGLKARFVGSVDAPRRAELLCASDALVLPSVTLPAGRTEGLPLVLSEAMAAGLPVIASDTGSVTELVVHEETGLLFPEKDSEALVRCLRRLQNDRDFSISIAASAKEYVKKRDWDTVIDDILPLIGLAEVKWSDS